MEKRAREIALQAAITLNNGKIATAEYIIAEATKIEEYLTK